MAELLDFFTQLSLFSVFLTLSIVGISIFAIAFFFDGLFDFEIGIAGADVPTVQLFGVFMGTGGAAGLISLGLGIRDAIPAIIVAIIVGLALCVLFIFLMRYLQKSSEQLTNIDVESLRGEIVPVSWWNNTTGEVLVSLGGNTFKVAAESARKINSPQQLVIQEAKASNDRLVKVIVDKF